LKIGDYDASLADLERSVALAKGSCPRCEASLQQASDANRAKAAPTGRRIALVIGNSRYLHSPILPNAANDAADVAKELQKLGYEVFGHPKTDFVRSQLVSEIEAFKKTSVGASAAVVWYSGHGHQMLEEGSELPFDWIIPVDAQINSKADVPKNALRLDELKIAVIAAKSLRLVVIDACRNSTFYAGSRATRGLSRNAPSPGVLVIFSTKPGNIAQDGDGRNSPFALAFLENIRNKPQLDVRQLFSAVTGRVLELTKNEQAPETVSGLTSGDTLALAQ
jgi:uncharacterized caspase-like protein